MFIEDGKGKNGLASVSVVQRLNVSAKTATRQFYAARDFGLSYVTIYDGMTVAAGDICAYLKNSSSSRNLFIKTIDVSGAEAIKWKIFAVTGAAASGASVTPASTNLAKSITADAVAMSGDTAITGLTTGDQLDTFRSVATGGECRNYDGNIQLGPGDALAIEYDTGTTGLCEAVISFYYEALTNY